MTVSLFERSRTWMDRTFPLDVCLDVLERNDRLLEEVLELLQAADYPWERVGHLVTYVRNRPKGTVHAEVGGVMNTLYALCRAHGIHPEEAMHVEMDRIDTMSDAIRAKWLTKQRGSALPTAGPAVVLTRPTVALRPLQWHVFCGRTGNCSTKTAMGEFVVQVENGKWCVYKPGSDRRNSEHDTCELAKSHVWDLYNATMQDALA